LSWVNSYKFAFLLKPCFTPVGLFKNQVTISKNRLNDKIKVLLRSMLIFIVILSEDRYPGYRTNSREQPFICIFSYLLKVKKVESMHKYDNIEKKSEII